MCKNTMVLYCTSLKVAINYLTYDRIRRDIIKRVKKTKKRKRKKGKQLGVGLALVPVLGPTAI